MIYKIILPLIFTTISVFGEISYEFKYLTDPKTGWRIWNENSMSAFLDRYMEEREPYLKNPTANIQKYRGYQNAAKFKKVFEDINSKLDDIHEEYVDFLLRNRGGIRVSKDHPTFTFKGIPLGHFRDDTLAVTNSLLPSTSITYMHNFKENELFEVKYESLLPVFKNRTLPKVSFKGYDDNGHEVLYASVFHPTHKKLTTLEELSSKRIKPNSNHLIISKGDKFIPLDFTDHSETREYNFYKGENHIKHISFDYNFFSQILKLDKAFINMENLTLLLGEKFSLEFNMHPNKNEMHALDTKKGFAIQISKSHRKVNFITIPIIHENQITKEQLDKALKALD